MEMAKSKAMKLEVKYEMTTTLIMAMDVHLTDKPLKTCLYVLMVAPLPPVTALNDQLAAITQILKKMSDQILFVGMAMWLKMSAEMIITLLQVMVVLTHAK